MERAEILQQFNRAHDNMLGILHALQDNNPYNYLDEDDLRSAASYLNTTLSHVYGVATYYTMFSVKPRGKYIVRACNSPVCDMKGSVNLIDTLKKILSVDIGQTTKDRMFTLELTECLGQCHIAPVMMINEKIYGMLDENRIASLIDNYKNK